MLRYLSGPALLRTMIPHHLCRPPQPTHWPGAAGCLGRTGAQGRRNGAGNRKTKHRTWRARGSMGTIVMVGASATRAAKKEVYRSEEQTSELQSLMRI